MKEKEKSVFEVLNAIDCSKHIESRGKFKYLSWAWAWQIVKLNYPQATYTIYENAVGLNYHSDGHTCWVKTGVTIEGIEHIEYLPVMDFNNASIPVEKVTSFDVNKSIQRSLTKACARHGLGLYIYAGEDLPSDGMTKAVDMLEKDFDVVAELTQDIKAEINEAGSAEEFTAVKNKYIGTAYNKAVQEALCLRGVQLNLWDSTEAQRMIKRIK